MDEQELENEVQKYGYADISQNMIVKRKSMIKRIKNLTSTDLFNTTKTYNKFLSDELCRWIIHEAEIYSIENGGWTTKRHKNYPTTDLPLRLIPGLGTPIMNMTISNIFPLIAKQFDLNPYFLNVSDIFIVKYDINGQDHLDFHRDGSIISFNILLNDEFDGGGTIINHIKDDRTTISTLHTINKGDLFMHSGKLLHSGNKITSGTRYIIVGFVEYCFQLLKSTESSDRKKEEERFF